MCAVAKGEFCRGVRLRRKISFESQLTQSLSLLTFENCIFAVCMQKYASLSCYADVQNISLEDSASKICVWNCISLANLVVKYLRILWKLCYEIFKNPLRISNKKHWKQRIYPDHALQFICHENLEHCPALTKNFWEASWSEMLAHIKINLKTIEKNFMKAARLSQGVLCSPSQVQWDKRDKCPASPLQHI